jgi:hypothetical protein
MPIFSKAFSTSVFGKVFSDLSGSAIFGGAGWTWDFTKNLYPSFFNFSRASSAIYFDSSGNLQIATTNQPRFDYNKVTLAPLGLLMEGTRTNLLTYSADLTNASWSKSNSTFAISGTAPDGTASANLWTRTSTSGAFFSKNTAKAASAITYTDSVYIKYSNARYFALLMQGTYPSQARATFDLQTGTVSQAASVGGSFTNAAATITNAGGGWYRVTLTYTTDTNTTLSHVGAFNTQNVVLANDVDVVSTSAGLLWGFQSEQLSWASSYIPTTTATATRAYDSASISNLSTIGFNASEGTLIVEWVPETLSYTEYVRILELGDGSANNLISLLATPSANRVSLLVNAGGVTQADTGLTSTAYLGAGTNKAAIAFKANRAITACNGTLGAEDTSLTVPAGITKLNLLGPTVGTYGFNFGWVRKVTYYPMALSNAQLQSLTQ